MKTNDKKQRTTNTGLAKVAVQCSADTFVVKIANFAKPKTVIEHVNSQQKVVNCKCVTYLFFSKKD